ncbi:MAG: flagellar basal body-associated FliL family protein [Nitrospinae bacterium]|nr:flagellar basal body-associated FliL family protein [Nitrospinota bacterium]
MAMEEGLEAGGEGLPQPKKAKSKLALILVIAVLMVGLIGVGGYLAVSMLGGKKAAKGGAEQGAPAAEGEHGGGGGEAKGGEHGGGGESGGEGKMGLFVSLDPFIVNLASDAGKRYLKVTMQLELARPEMTNEVNNRMPQIKDAIITVLSSKPAEELLTIEGKFRLKEQVLTRVNNLLTSGVVKNVFFVEFVIQ